MCFYSFIIVPLNFIFLILISILPLKLNPLKKALKTRYMCFYFFHYCSLKSKFFNIDINITLKTKSF